MEEGQKKSNRKQLLLVVLLLLVIAVLFVFLLIKNKGKEVVDVDTNTMQEQESGEDLNQAEEKNNQEEISPVETEEVNPVLQGAVTKAPGANLVTTDGRVVDEEGREVRSDVAYNDPSAPDQTLAITNQDEIKDASKLSLGDNGFSPNRFTVSAGSAVTLSLTGTNDSSHVLAFRSSELSAVYINIRAGETRAVTFQAPSNPGEYEFFCDFPGHSSESGVMVVE